MKPATTMSTSNLPGAGKPILFSAAMVRAILAGTKTQTRRAMKPQPSECFTPSPCEIYHPTVTDKDGFEDAGPPIFGCYDKYGGDEGYKCPYGSLGSKLWVRETWAHGLGPIGERFDYRADCELPPVGNQRWKPSIHMPRKASRITLEIESVRVERLQDISEEDAKAEGVESWIETREPSFMRCRGIFNDDYHRRQYEDLWESINGKGSWARNDFVWAITFRRLAKEPK